MLELQFGKDPDVTALFLTFPGFSNYFLDCKQEKQGLEFVLFVARVFATVLPSLDSFNIQAAVATGKIVPPDYLGFAGLYAAAYVGAAILLAFILFEDRDLA